MYAKALYFNVTRNNGCIAHAKTSAFIDECTLLIVDQMASGAQL